MRALAAMVLLVAGCKDVNSSFACRLDADCFTGGVQGRCEPTRGCSFPSAECASGWRYGSFAPSGLSGQCVGVPDGAVADALATDARADCAAPNHVNADAGRTCGGTGQPCCAAGTLCLPQLTCVNNVCTDCGWRGEVCCPGSLCDPIACIGCTCTSCGLCQ